MMFYLGHVLLVETELRVLAICNNQHVVLGPMVGQVPSNESQISAVASGECKFNWGQGGVFIEASVFMNPHSKRLGTFLAIRVRSRLHGIKWLIQSSRRENQFRPPSMGQKILSKTGD